MYKRQREVYLEQEAFDDRFRVIDCSAPDGSMLDPDSIFERIEMCIRDRARAGLFLGFQYPVEIPGVSMALSLIHI